MQFVTVNLIFLAPVYSCPQFLNQPRSLQPPGPDYKEEQMTAKPARSLCRVNSVLFVCEGRRSGSDDSQAESGREKG